MIFHERCAIKINLSLRVLGRRTDGLHDIRSVFWRRPSPEVLEIDTTSSCDDVRCIGIDIPGENIVTRAIAHARAIYADAMPRYVRVTIHKHLPPGSGIGAGSGNAAAIFSWLHTAMGAPAVEPSSLLPLGADVAFVASGLRLASVNGAGERIEALNGELDHRSVIFFPEWSSNTGEAYARIDRARANGEHLAMTEEAAEVESREVVGRLMAGESVGLLPNDFYECEDEQRRTRYDALFASARGHGAVAWGLCGSGSSCFALFGRDDEGAMTKLVNGVSMDDGFKWVRQILIVE